MDEKKKDNLYRFFYIWFIVLLIIYISFNVGLLFSISISTHILAFLCISIFFLITIRNAINEKFEELGNVASNGILSVRFFSTVIACCCIVRGFYLPSEQGYIILWSLLALYVSIPLDQSIRALRKLK